MIRDPYQYLAEQLVEGPVDRKYLYTLYATYKQGFIGFFLVFVVFVYCCQMFILQELFISFFTVIKITLSILEILHEALIEILLDKNLFENSLNIFLISFAYPSICEIDNLVTTSFINKGDIYFQIYHQEFTILFNILYDSTVNFVLVFMKTLLLYESLVSDEGNFFLMVPGVIPHYLNKDYITNTDVLDLFKFNSFALQYEQRFIIDALMRYSIYILDNSEGMTLHGRLIGIIPDSLLNVLLHQKSYLSLYKFYIPIYSSLFPDYVDNTDSSVLLDLAFSSFQDFLHFFIDKLFFTFYFYVELLFNLFSYNDRFLTNSYSIIKSPNSLFFSTDFYIDSYSVLDFSLEERTNLAKRQANTHCVVQDADFWHSGVLEMQNGYMFKAFFYFPGSDFFKNLPIYDSRGFTNEVKDGGDRRYIMDLFQLALYRMDPDIKLNLSLLQNFWYYHFFLGSREVTKVTDLDVYQYLSLKHLTDYMYPSQFKISKIKNMDWIVKKTVFQDIGIMYKQYPLHPSHIKFVLEGQDRLAFGYDIPDMFHYEFHEVFDRRAILEVTTTQEAKVLKDGYLAAFNRDIAINNPHHPSLLHINSPQFGILLNNKKKPIIDFLKYLVRDNWLERVNTTVMLPITYLPAATLKNLCFKSIQSSDFIPFLTSSNANMYYSLVPNQNSFLNSQCFNSFTEFILGLQENDFDFSREISFSKIRTFYDFDFYKLLNISNIIIIFFIFQKIYKHSIKSIKEILIDYVHYNHTIVYDFIEFTLKFIYVKLIFVTLYYLYFFGSTFLFFN